MEPLPLPVVVVLVAVAVAAVTDLRAFKIHNALTLPLLASGLAYHAYAAGPGGLAASAVGAAFGFGVVLVVYLAGGMGGGDVKLMAGVGAWLGAPLTLTVFVAASVAAGVYALVLVVACGRLAETWANLRLMWHRVAAVGRHLGGDDRVEDAVRAADRRRRLVPFGAMLGVGLVALVVLARVWPQ